jgi:hypothetical protein
MFRAGGEPRGIPALATGPATYLADISEYEPSVSDAAYLAWSKAIVIRAAYGDQHDDTAWYSGARRDALHAGGVRFLGIYQYLVAGQDAAAQAHELVRLVGRLRPGEKLFADLEEGDGDQYPRYRQWLAVIAAAYGMAHGAAPWLYSGLYFSAMHNLKPEWLAAYQGDEPAPPHLLWQFSPAYPVPGVGLADCSVFHGSIGQLAAYAYQPAPHPVPPPEDDMVNVSPLQLPDYGGPGGKTPAVTVDLSSAGTHRAIGFSSDWSLAGQPQPRIRVAVHSVSKEFSQIADEPVPAKGKLVIHFAEPDVDYVSVARSSESAALVSAGT